MYAHEKNPKAPRGTTVAKSQRKCVIKREETNNAQKEKFGQNRVGAIRLKKEDGEGMDYNSLSQRRPYILQKQRKAAGHGDIIQRWSLTQRVGPEPQDNNYVIPLEGGKGEEYRIAIETAQRKINEWRTINLGLAGERIEVPIEVYGQRVTFYLGGRQLYTLGYRMGELNVRLIDSSATEELRQANRETLGAVGGGQQPWVDVTQDLSYVGDVPTTLLSDVDMQTLQNGVNAASIKTVTLKVAGWIIEGLRNIIVKSNVKKKLDYDNSYNAPMHNVLAKNWSNLTALRWLQGRNEQIAAIGQVIRDTELNNSIVNGITDQFPEGNLREDLPGKMQSVRLSVLQALPAQLTHAQKSQILAQNLDRIVSGVEISLL